MEEICILIFVSLFASISLEKAESVKVKLEEMPLKTFDEIFGESCWDKDEAEDLKKPAPINFGQNVHHQIDRQNTQLGQIEPNSTDQNPPLAESDHSVRFEPNSTDQNPPLTESDHSGQIDNNSTDQNSPHPTESDRSDNAKNSKKQNEIIKEITSNNNIAVDERKRKIIDKFHSIKNEIKQKGKFSTKEWNQIDGKIAKHLNANRTKIYEWKKEFGLSQKVVYEKEERKLLVEKFDQMKAELKRDGFKNSYPNQINKIVAKVLGFCFKTIYNWKKLGQSTPKHKYSHSEQKELMKSYYEIKDQNSKISDEKIAKRLSISRVTLYRWKRQFKRQQLLPNSVEENAAANIQEPESI